VKFFKWIGDGNIKVNIDSIFDLKDVQKGHEYIEKGQTTGKVVFDCKKI